MRPSKSLRQVVRFAIWRERVAPDCDAWCCYGEVVRNGRLYAGGTMMLTETSKDYYPHQRERIVLKFVEEAKSGRMAGTVPIQSWHGIPFAGFLRDLRR